MKMCIEYIQHLRFKLRMFGVPLDRGQPAHILCDNKNIVKNSTKLESLLNKKTLYTVECGCRCYTSWVDKW